MSYSTKKKVLSVALLMVLLLNIISLPTNVEAKSEIGVILNGEKLNFDVNPTAVNNRTFVPIRAILESLGMNVTWDQPSQTVIGRKGKDVINIALDDDGWDSSTYNGMPFFNEEVPNLAIKGRTLVPLRSTADILGLEVKWDQYNNDVILTDSSKDQLTIEDAYNIFKSTFNFDPDYIHVYLPFGGYAADNSFVLSNYYTFVDVGVHKFINSDGYEDKDFYAPDYSICVHKVTGDMKSYHPTTGLTDLQ